MNQLSIQTKLVRDNFILDIPELTLPTIGVTALFGRSGSGKSTLLKLCSDLISPTSGYITYNGQDLTSIDPENYRKEVGYCFQRPYS